MSARRFASRLTIAGLVVCAAAATSCGAAAIDLANALQVVDITSGWYDAGVVQGNMNKLVPSISLKLKNVGPAIPGSVQLNAVFRRIGETEELGSAFLRAVDSNGLASGATTDTIVMRSTQGYTGTEPRAQMLQNSQFVDAKVEIFAKYGSAEWVKLGEYPIPRQLLTR